MAQYTRSNNILTRAISINPDLSLWLAKAWSGLWHWMLGDGLEVVIIALLFIGIVVSIRQDISRNIARQATLYSYKVGQKAKCQTENGGGLFMQGPIWVDCTIVSVTPDHRYYTAQYLDSNSNKQAISKFSIQNIGVQ